MILFSVIVIFLVIIDQTIKFFVQNNMYEGSIEVIENIFSLTYLKNYGAAWGIFADSSWLLSIVSPILIITIIYYLFKYSNSNFEFVTGALVVGGAVGNYIDRLYRGYVIDYIDFKIWPIFNFADICIVVGCVLFSINLIRRDNKDGD